MSMTSHPVAFGTIEHTEKAGELLGELAKANEALAREASIARMALTAIRSHWREFGPECGFDETLEEACKVLEA